MTDATGGERSAAAETEAEAEAETETEADAETETEAEANAGAATEVVLVAAVAENGVIGRDGGMPWHYPADLRQFKRTTTGHPVIMGRRTYESIAADVGGPLPDRTSVVLTRDPDGLSVPDGVVVAAGPDEALSAAADRDRVVYVVGGATVYEAFLPRADRMRLTRVPGSPDGDTYFPEWDAAGWREANREPLGDDGLELVEYERRRG